MSDAAWGPTISIRCEKAGCGRTFTKQAKTPLGLWRSWRAVRAVYHAHRNQHELVEAYSVSTEPIRNNP